MLVAQIKVINNNSSTIQTSQFFFLTICFRMIRLTVTWKSIMPIHFFLGNFAVCADFQCSANHEENQIMNFSFHEIKTKTTIYTVYSKTCYGRPPLRPSKCGLARQVVSHDRGTHFRKFIKESCPVSQTCNLFL
jgi:hypothetical protein